ncbi:hypothetical protein COB11_03290 [Candidatus Aerophobetes bacterium]|uniref:Uncharacterized protein n=1 Tax=Aerophobetes bacterium TaxID=2030807 RepID=A0A2A4YJA2_UNCAE|nr:MAG: hypothetical protein COB11_03290 [Candidatus Aerophobetes bacterium]
MSIQYVDESMPFTYFMTHEGSENVLLQELDKNHGGASELQKHAVNFVKKDRESLSLSVKKFALYLFAGVLLVIPGFRIASTACILVATWNTPDILIRVNNLYQNYKALQTPPAQLTDATRV